MGNLPLSYKKHWEIPQQNELPKGYHNTINEADADPTRFGSGTNITGSS
jgi:hypothetical protein